MERKGRGSLVLRVLRNKSFFQPSKSLQAKRAHRNDDVYWVGGEGGREGLELKLIELNVHQS